MAKLENRLLARAMRLCAGNAAVRALGFGMRAWLARVVSEQSMGIYEMSAQLGMLLLSPLVSGLPQAASRVSAQYIAKNDEVGADMAGRASRIMAGLGAALICLLCLPFTPLLARGMGDARMAAPFLMMLPSMIPLALCAVYYGCMYARGSTLPASLQLTEQSVRMVCAFVLITALGGMGGVLDASLLAIAQTAGAVVAFAFTRAAAKSDFKPEVPRKNDYRGIFKVAWPISLSRMSAAGLRSINQLTLPGRLALAGLTSAQAMGEYGVLSGMAMPTVFLPFMFTGPLASLALPRIAASHSHKEATHIARRTLIFSVAIGLAACGVLWVFGPMAGQAIFKNERAGELIRFLAPLAPLGCITQTLNALLQGISCERAALRWTLGGALISTVLTWILCARPELNIYGFGLAMMAGQAVTLAGQIALLAIKLPRFNVESGVAA